MFSALAYTHFAQMIFFEWQDMVKIVVFPLDFFSSCRLEYCELTGDIVEALNAALQSKPTLKELSLSNNTLGDTAVKQLCRGLVEASCNLELLQ